MMDDKKLAELAESIASQGLLMPVVLFGGKILDGRNRYLACQQAGVEPRFVNFEGDNPWEYVWSTNAERRHLTDGQKYLIWLKKNELSTEWEAKRRFIRDEANLKRSEATRGQPRSEDGTRLVSGGGTDSTATCGGHPSRQLKAEASKTNRGAVAKGDVLYTKRPDLAEKVIAGAVSMEAALREVKNEEVVRQLEDIKGREAKQACGVYDAIVIDPPWPMTKIDRDVRPNQTAFDYPVMSIQELEGLKIPAAGNCHVWLWTTHKYMKMAFHLLEVWGLRYVCTFVWHKPGGFQPYGLPQYNCEFALYARKGSPKFIDITEFFTCFSAARGRHSEKPLSFYETVQRVTGGRRLDMFSRRKIEGFDGWGNES
jgi:N6-adenosine-specific RNA methylase IME4